MKSPRKNKLAASFVVTVAAVTSLEGCRKQTVENTPEGPESRVAYLSRNGDRCQMSPPEHCPKGASCNPPPPTEIDCPPSLRDAGEAAPAAAARPSGKEDWLRAKPRLWASGYGCGYTSEFFCAAPPKPHACTPFPPTVTIKCKSVAVAVADAGARSNDVGPWTLESFVYKDGLGACHEVPAFECKKTDCLAEMPPDKPAPCPP